MRLLFPRAVAVFASCVPGGLEEVTFTRNSDGCTDRIVPVGVALMKRISYMPSGASSGSVTATALPVANSADWIVVLYKYIAIDYKRVMPPPEIGRGDYHAGISDVTISLSPIAHIFWSVKK